MHAQGDQTQRIFIKFLQYARVQTWHKDFGVSDFKVSTTTTTISCFTHACHPHCPKHCTHADHTTLPTTFPSNGKDHPQKVGKAMLGSQRSEYPPNSHSQS